MLTRLPVAGVLFVVGALTLLASPTWAQNKCQGAKAKAAAKKAACILGGDAKVLAKGGTFDPSTCQSKFATAWGKIEAKGGCATTGDLTAIENMVDSFAASVTSALSATPTTTTATTTTTTTTIPCGAVVGSFCWFKAADGANCDATCTAAGRVYDVATRDYAGSNGTDANCGAVAAALGPVISGPTDGTSTGGFGCVDLEASANGVIFRITSPATDSTSAPVSGFRFCACQ
jgi:hypothetical protein